MYVEDIKFSLAVILYQYFKFLELKMDVSEFYEKISFHTEAKIIKSYYLNKNNSYKTVELKFFDNFICVFRFLN